jgi:hypothetical protein
MAHLREVAPGQLWILERHSTREALPNRLTSDLGELTHG